MSLYIDLNYNIKNNKLYISTNIKEEKVEDIMFSFLRTQAGQGEDNSPANEMDEYRILIELNLNFDIFNVTDNCGNKGLRDGIIMYYLQNKEKWE